MLYTSIEFSPLILIDCMHSTLLHALTVTPLLSPRQILKKERSEELV